MVRAAKWLSAATVLMGLVMAGCDKQPAAGPEAAGTRATPATTAAGGGSKVSVVYIPKNAGNPYFDAVEAGFRKAAAETGEDFTLVAPATSDATSQLPIIKDQVERGVNVIAISPNSPDALNPALKDAMAHGVTVITVDCDLTGSEQDRTACVFTVDPETVGKTQVELMGSLMNYEGKFVILSATTDAPNQNAWIAVMKKTLAEDPKYKQMDLVDVVYGEDEPQKSLTECEAVLTKYPDLKGVLAPTTVGISAAAQCVATAGKARQVHVTGLGTPDQMRRYVKDGTVKAFALWDPAEEGYLAGVMGKQLAGKSLTPAKGVKFTAGDLGEREFKENNVVIAGPPLSFTAGNIDKYHF